MIHQSITHGPLSFNRHEFTRGPPKRRKLSLMGDDGQRSWPKLSCLLGSLLCVPGSPSVKANMNNLFSHSRNTWPALRTDLSTPPPPSLPRSPAPEGQVLRRMMIFLLPPAASPARESKHTHTHTHTPAPGPPAPVLDPTPDRVSPFSRENFTEE